LETHFLEEDASNVGKGKLERSRAFTHRIRCIKNKVVMKMDVYSLVELPATGLPLDGDSIVAAVTVLDVVVVPIKE
jgi:hypothetical protein